MIPSNASTGNGGRRRTARLSAVLAAMLLAITVLATGCAGQTSPGSVDVPTRDAVVNPAVNAAGLTKSIPTRIEVPSIGVDSSLMGLGLDATGAMQVPAEGFPAGWYTGAPTPGETGPAVIAGHVDWAGAPGVFFELANLEPGAEIAVTREDGSIARFEVTEVTTFPKDEFPTDLVYGTLDYAGLRLITCGGAFDESASSYQDNVVAFAKLVGTG
ncbi:sortase family protein [Williamsia muralis]|uniref:Sortase family protein n=1 Tax=Williamsia marianensis TaxID=85044 RepID=A0A495KBQ7_WILMA|nr:class F sortase [Williamsia muralis]RKR97642.1 sortase family protein [Williamsia muralis]